MTLREARAKGLTKMRLPVWNEYAYLEMPRDARGYYGIIGHLHDPIFEEVFKMQGLPYKTRIEIPMFDNDTSADWEEFNGPEWKKQSRRHPMINKLLRIALEMAPIKTVNEDPLVFIDRYETWFRTLRHNALKTTKELEHDLEVYGNAYIYEGKRLDPTKIVIKTNKNSEHAENEPQTLKELCTLIGCSGESKDCPGNPNCQILIKLTGTK